MYYSLLTASAVLLAVVLLLLCRYLGRTRRTGRLEDAAGFTVIPLRGDRDPRLTERLIRACCWENAFGGGMARRVLLVSCGCAELDSLGARLAEEFEDIRIVSAGGLAAAVLDGYEKTGTERKDDRT